MDSEFLDRFRYFLKDDIRRKIDFRKTPQNMGVPPPPVEKPYPDGSKLLDLVPVPDLKDISETTLSAAIRGRRSRRAFTRGHLSLKELSFLLWAIQGIRHVASPAAAFRTVPSAGCRHALETYLCAFNVSCLDQGVYRYLPIEHQLLWISSPENLQEKLSAAALGQEFLGRSAATFIWTAIPYRMEWRYDAASCKVIALDAGHVCQNLYLACEAIGSGTCAVAAYDQRMMDELLGVDGEDEFTIYLAPVGKIRRSPDDSDDE